MRSQGADVMAARAEAPGGSLGMFCVGLKLSPPGSFPKGRDFALSSGRPASGESGKSPEVLWALNPPEASTSSTPAPAAAPASSTLIL